MSKSTSLFDSASASSLLAFEQTEFESLLHDEFGQSLVAIRSMAAALAESDAEARADIAALIEQTADDAYAAVYDLMQELRAERSLQDGGFVAALQQAVDDARLEAQAFTCELRIGDTVPGLLDTLNQRLLLRSTRLFLNGTRRRLAGGGRIAIDIDAEAEKSEIRLEFGLRETPSAAALFEYPRLEKLGTRIAAFGGSLSMKRASTGDNACNLSVLLPCRKSENGSRT